MHRVAITSLGDIRTLNPVLGAWSSSKVSPSATPSFRPRSRKTICWGR
jgi:hypothetical protein